MRKLCVLLLAVWLMSPLAAEPLSADRQAQLKNLLQQDCGSCHGMRLTGGLGPALTTQALAGKSRELLVATISEGRPGTPMPPWKPLLSEADIQWLAEYLQSPGVAP
jgi:cytochrome c55X